jgi:uncharacterized protein
MSFEQLDVWLQTVEPAPPVTSLSMVDGYVTAIVVGPCSIPPDEWFAKLLGAHGHIATAAGDTMAAIMTIAKRFNDIGEGLSLAPDKHAPVFEKTDGGLVDLHPWCMGFVGAMQLRLKQWQPLLDLDRVDHALLLPILLYCTDPLGNPLLGPPREGPETEEFVRNAYHNIPLVIPAIRDFWMPRRLKNGRRQS